MYVYAVCLSFKLTVLRESVLHLGKYRGQTFRWCLENAVGYSAWLVDSSMTEKSLNSTLLLHKASFREYAMSLPEMRVQVAEKGKASKAKKDKQW